MFDFLKPKTITKDETAKLAETIVFHGDSDPTDLEACEIRYWVDKTNGDRRMDVIVGPNIMSYYDRNFHDVYPDDDDGVEFYRYPTSAVIHVFFREAVAGEVTRLGIP